MRNLHWQSTANKRLFSAARQSRTEKRRRERRRSETWRLAGQNESSGSFGELLPLFAGKLDQLAADRLELGGTVVVFDFLRVVGDSIN